jgi:hypothetical protein
MKVCLNLGFRRGKKEKKKKHHWKRLITFSVVISLENNKDVFDEWD